MNLEKLTEGIRGNPQFSYRIVHDWNPLSGNRKNRRICAPNEAMREVHRRLIRELNKLRSTWALLSLPCVSAARRGDSAVLTVRRHRWNRYFYILDISQAFPSVDLARLAQLLNELDPDISPEPAKDFLKKYVMDPIGGVAVGGPASNLLFNLYAAHFLDSFLLPLCEKYHLTYTRYLDDLIFSSSGRRHKITDEARREIRTIFAEKAPEFKISHHKCKVVDLKKGAVPIMGICLAWRGRLTIPGQYMREVERMLRVWLSGNRAVEGEALIPPSRIQGKMAIIHHVQRVRGNAQPKNATEKRLAVLYRRFMIRTGVARVLR